MARESADVSQNGLTMQPKREAFRRLAEKRTSAILDRIRVLSNLANPYAYQWEEAEIRQMFDAIEEELRLAKAKFQQVERRRRAFRLR